MFFFKNVHFNYMLQFTMLYHQLVKYENPNMIFKDMGAFIRTKWKAMESIDHRKEIM